MGSCDDSVLLTRTERIGSGGNISRLTSPTAKPSFACRARESNGTRSAGEPLTESQQAVNSVRVPAYWDGPQRRYRRCFSDIHVAGYDKLSTSKSVEGGAMANSLGGRVACAGAHAGR